MTLKLKSDDLPFNERLKTNIPNVVFMKQHQGWHSLDISLLPPSSLASALLLLIDPPTLTLAGAS